MMIDIHSHILPEVDDGSKDMEMSLRIARLYIENGYSKVIATPHWIEYSGTTYKEENIKVLDSFKKCLKEEEIPLEIYLGNEFFITPNLIQYIEEKKGSTLNDSSYVLVELPLADYPRYTEEVLFDLQLKGYRPIIAHPERYLYFAKEPNLLASLIEKGILVQMNLPSLGGQYGKEIQKAAITFLEHDFVHLVGTDTHSDRKRSPRVQDAIEKLVKIVGEEKKELMTKIRPEYILKNQSFEVDLPKEMNGKRWWEIWKSFKRNKI